MNIKLSTIIVTLLLVMTGVSAWAYQTVLVPIENPGSQIREITEKPEITVGTIGPSGHGKTTLTSAITSVLAKEGLCDYYSFDLLDNSPEEKEHGTTIETDEISYQTSNRVYLHIDCPGHPDYIANTTNALARLAGAIFVVSAVDDLTPDIFNQVQLASECEVPVLIGFINKCDMVSDPTIIENVEKELRNALSENGYDGQNTPIIKGSALGALIGIPEWEAGIIDLLDAMDSWIPICDRTVGFHYLKDN